MNLYRKLTVLLALWVCGSALAQDEQTLTVTSWGGAYESAQRVALFDPFEQDTGIEVVLHPYSGGIEPLLHDRKDSLEFDVADLVESDALLACDEGILVELDSSMLEGAADGTSAEDDFIEDAWLACGIAHIEYATVVAYDERAFKEEKPSSIADFFDLDRFPGKRALQRHPRAILEWAMLSYGIPPQQIYELLSSERGLNLVTRRMNQIRDHIVWWESGSEPPQLLGDGTVVMASGYNGRFFEATMNHDAAISVIQDGHLLEFGVWGILRDSPNQDAAAKFVRYVTGTQKMADFSNRIPYSPTRSSSIRRIGLHEKSNVSMLTYMTRSTSTSSSNVVRIASGWYSRTEKVRERWFNEWLSDGQN
ncbi:MAG: extracellular solute-binding protein [Acidiferrobacterales bacterium]|nr:extracellular solute-binding protein [Acidiferrobacterales bacterium]